MNGDFVTRREFMRLTAGAFALEAASTAGALQATTPSGTASPPAPIGGTDAEMAIAKDWANSLGAASAIAGVRSGGGRLLPDRLKAPFSFTYGGKDSAGLLPGWNYAVKSSRIDSHSQETEAIYLDPATGLQVRVVATSFEDFPAVEWTVFFKNSGTSDTPLLENIQALDTHLQSPDRDPVIHYSRGAMASMDDFMPMNRTLGENGRLHLNAGGGRSSSQTLPFFNLEGKGEGAVMAIGWTGEWAAAFEREHEQQFRVSAGMALTHLVLHPGEEIRTPRILMLFWLGQEQRGHNLLRRFILAHHRPEVAGKPISAPICAPHWGGTSAAKHLENIRQIVAHDLPIEYYWIDAEWFGVSEWWRNPGNWKPRSDLYPEGFKPISDLLHASGRKLLLWFEPERVCEGTPWYTEHAEWLLAVPKERKVYRGFGAEGDREVAMSDPRWVPNESGRNQIQENDKLFNLAIPEARQFLTDFISSKIDEFGLDCFRNDANIAPLEFWRAADEPDRQGITEIRWVEGLYAFWDELRRRHPHLIIDNCASGGRRIDLETIGRATPLSRTDFVGNVIANQCHSHGLLRWVPLNNTGIDLSTHNEYKIRSTMTAGLDAGLFSTGDNPQGITDYTNFPFAEVKKSLDRYREVQKYFYGDFYPLTEYTQTEDAWMAYQLDLPGEGEGLLVVLKRPLSRLTRGQFPLSALEPGSYYETTDLDSGEKKSFTGQELMERGMSVSLLAQPDSALFRYRRKA